ncbi:MAG: peptidylprolyl isomerase, partial [Planctomycetota bacterium]|nr:peptidylprolyl isomerase [Planctomycetota bacterium]
SHRLHRFIGIIVISVLLVGSCAVPPPLKLVLTCEQKEVVIGNWVNLNLSLFNLTPEEMEVLKPVIDIDSVSLQIKQSPLVGERAEWGFVYSLITPSVYEHNRATMERIKLGKKGTPESEFRMSFRLPAVSIALYQITASYSARGGPSGQTREPVSSEPVSVRVVSPACSERSESSGKDEEIISIIETSKGMMKARFFLREAPNTVLNFIRLAKEGFYNNLTFHRIAKGFVIQGGCPNGNGSGGPGYSIRAEFNPNKHLKGVLSMARSSHNDSAGSQFFICLDAVPRLDNQYTTFGELIDGIEVLDAIGNVKTAPNPNRPEELSQPLEEVIIQKISFEYKER